MCGFIGIFDSKQPQRETREKALHMSSRIRHRGPDWSGVYCSEHCTLAHERLAIVDPLSGGQPLYSPDKKTVLAVNGEIYNHQGIRERLAGEYAFQTGSDCEVILALYKEKGAEFLEDLNGIFAFALYDETQHRYLIARDPIGVIPLYIGYDEDGTVYVASELKALEGMCERYEPFPPGHLMDSADGVIRRWWTRDWFDYEAVKDGPASRESLREALQAAVKRQLMSDVPYGVLLSGGLDSSVISAIAAMYSRNRIETQDKSEAWWPRLHSFAVGLKGSPDLEKARIVLAFSAVFMAASSVRMRSGSRPHTSVRYAFMRPASVWPSGLFSPVAPPVQITRDWGKAIAAAAAASQRPLSSSVISPFTSSKPSTTKACRPRTGMVFGSSRPYRSGE